MNLKSIGGYYFFFFSPIFGGRYMCRIQRQLTGSGSFYHVGPRDQIQVIRGYNVISLSYRCLYTFNHLTDSFFFF